MQVEGQFSAAHSIREYPGPCCNLHGHNYRVVVHLSGTQLDSLGMLIDYTEVKKALSEVLAPLDHAHLNDLPPFAEKNPTSERIAEHIYLALRDLLMISNDIRQRVSLDEVTVYESERQGVGYGDKTNAHL